MPNNNTEAPRLYPALRYRNASKMIDWLVEAFGFSVHARYGDGDVVHHAQLAFGSSMIMIGSARDDAYGELVGAPGSKGGGKSIYVAVDDADKLYARAKTAGATVEEELTDRDYGSSNSSAATRKAMSGHSAPIGQRRTSQPRDF